MILYTCLCGNAYHEYGALQAHLALKYMRGASLRHYQGTTTRDRRYRVL